MSQRYAPINGVLAGSPAACADIEFLNLDGCNADERVLIQSILRAPPRAGVGASVASTGPLAVSPIGWSTNPAKGVPSGSTPSSLSLSGVAAPSLHYPHPGYHNGSGIHPGHPVPSVVSPHLGITHMAVASMAMTATGPALMNPMGDPVLPNATLSPAQMMTSAPPPFITGAIPARFMHSNPMYPIPNHQGVYSHYGPMSMPMAPPSALHAAHGPPISYHMGGLPMMPPAPSSLPVIMPALHPSLPPPPNPSSTLPVHLTLPPVPSMPIASGHHGTGVPQWPVEPRPALVEASTPDRTDCLGPSALNAPEAVSPPALDTSPDLLLESGETEVVEPALDEETVGPSAPQKSWASLFVTNVQASSIDHATAGAGGPAPTGKPTARIPPYTEGYDSNVNGEAGVAMDGSSSLVDDAPLDHTLHGKMAHYFTHHVLNHKSPSIKPRGLTNRSNWCFTNAILQALVACPPFYNFMRELPIHEDPLPHQTHVVVDTSRVKMLKAVWDFIDEFEVMTNFPKLNRSKTKKTEDLSLGKPLEAASIFNILLNLSTDTFKVTEGQQDAEEFLTFLLNGLNDEMLAILKEIEEKKKGPSHAAPPNEVRPDDSDDWKEVGPKNKSCITRRQPLTRTPLANMFQGQIRFCVQHGNAEPRATLQPFFTLQLDLQQEGVSNVKEALSRNFSPETLQDNVGNTTNQEVDITHNLSLEELPPILILHMKRFIYNDTSGGCQKLLKHVAFPIDLEISKDILSANSRGKYGARQKLYKLFAVVYHHGGEATKGHYVTDMYHTGFASWLRCDDSSVRPVTEAIVLTHTTNNVPYILFYRRGDTMTGTTPAQGAHKTGKV